MRRADELVGVWVSDPEDHEGIREFGRTTLDFESDGQLTYTIHADGKEQKMFLTFEVDANTIITDQPSAPRQQRSVYSIGADGKLTLWFGGQRAVYIRSE